MAISCAETAPVPVRSFYETTAPRRREAPDCIGPRFARQLKWVTADQSSDDCEVWHAGRLRSPSATFSTGHTLGRNRRRTLYGNGLRILLFRPFDDCSVFGMHAPATGCFRCGLKSNIR